MAVNFKHPARGNVDLGDLLIASDANGKLETMPIIKTNDEYIVGFIKDEVTVKKYEDSVVLKKDGTYLVGKEVRYN